MKSLDDVLDEIIKSEGGWVNDPDDLGGATKFGITIGTMRRLGIDLDGDRDVDAADVKLLTKERAKEIYKRHYYEKTRVGLLPEEIQANVLDAIINSGNNGTKLLQRLLNKMYPSEKLAVDGALGPNTARVAHKAQKEHGELFNDSYAIERRAYYYRIADKRVQNRKFATTRKNTPGGWIKRAESFMRPRYHYTLAQHRERVKKW